MRASLGCVGLGLVVGLVLGLGPAAPSAPGRAAGDLVEILPTPRAGFSPNGDGRRDTLPVRFRLAERARVTVLLRPLDRVVDLGVRPAGANRWTWDGRGAPSGSYRLVVRAETAAGRSGLDARSAEVDRGETLRTVEIAMTRRTIYPTTPDKRDAIHVRSSKAGNATGVSLVDDDGDVVLTDRFFTWWVWTGEGGDGTLLAPGEYDAVFSLRGRFGNRRDILRQVEVSPAELHRETWSTRVAAGQVQQFPLSECPPVASTRFEDGVTVASAGCDSAWFLPRIDVPVPLDPDVRWRFSVTGGPTTSGAEDTAVVSVPDQPNIAAVQTPTGDASTTTPWGAPDAYRWYRDPEPIGAVWTQDGASYDVAELTLEVTYWTPSAPPPRGRR